MAWFRKRTPVLVNKVRKNIESVAQLEQEFDRQRSPLDRVSDAITAFAGSIRFVIAHAVLFTAWIVLNTDWVLGPRAFDPYPFQFLNLAVALEAIFLSTFILMSQNRQNAQGEQWAHLDLQVNLLAEQETTKMLQMLTAISERLGLHRATTDKELEEMIETTHVEVLAQELDRARTGKDESPAAPEGEKRTSV
jgi:uncharacterized membrane protein